MDMKQGGIYAVILFIEASLGKTRYGSIMGLAIAGLKSTIRLIVRKCLRKDKTNADL